MFDKLNSMGDWLQTLQRLMENDDFRAFISHPKVRELLKDPEFMESLKSKDRDRLLKHPKFAVLRTDPEVAALLAKLNPQSFLQ